MKYIYIGAFVASTIDDTVVPLFLHKILLPEKIRNPQIVAEHTKKFEESIIPVLETDLNDQNYFNGDEVTIRVALYSSISIRIYLYIYISFIYLFHPIKLIHLIYILTFLSLFLSLSPSPSPSPSPPLLVYGR